MRIRGTSIAAASGVAVGLERVVSLSDAQPPNAPVKTGAAARKMAEAIRRITLASTSDRTYTEVEEFLDEEGRPTSDAERARKDAHTGRPVENPEHALWMQPVTLQTALMQAYLASRIALLTIGVGAGLVSAGAGIATASRR